MKKNLRIIFCCYALLLLVTSQIFAEKNIPHSSVSFVQSISASVTASGPLQFCKGGTVILTASNGDSFVWNTGANSQSIFVTESGSYQVVITTNGVEETSETITVLVWTISDAAGNTATAVQTVVVVDTEKPRISRIGKISVVNDPGQCGAIVKLITPRAIDNSGAPVIFTNNAPVFFSVGSVRIIWTGSDIYGNSDTTSQIITVIDNELPVITTTDIHVNNDPGKCGAVVNLGIPVTSDNCGVVSVTNNAPAFFPTGTTLVNWIVKDKAGFTNTVTQTVVVTDTEAPIFVAMPAAITVTCADIASLATPTVTDNCDSQPALSFVQTSTQSNNTSAKSFYNYVITRVWTVKDISGNYRSATQVITVVDNIAPTLTIPANISVSNSPNICGAVVNYTVSATDNCSSLVTISYSKKSGSEFPIGITTVTVTATDITGNKVSKSFTVTVTDTQKPLITVPKDIVTTVNSVNGKITNLSLGTPATSDNCGVKSVGNNAPASYSVGVTTVTWTVKDVNGNTSTAIQTVTVSVVSNSSAKKIAGTQSNATSNGFVTEKIETINAGIEVTVAPNPSATGFTLHLNFNQTLPVELRVMNILGNVVEAKSKLAPNSTLKIGEAYLPGLYFAELTQGTQHKVVQLLKLR